MININTIKDNSIVICPNSIKKDLLKLIEDSSRAIYIKLLNKSDVIKGIYFDYDYNALYHLHKQYNLNYSNAKEILDTLCGSLVDCSDKAHDLLEKYNYLKNNKLLKFNPLFKKIFTNKNVYIIGYSSKDIELKSALESIGVHYEFIDSQTNKNCHTVHEFKNMNDEILYVFNSIAKLVSEGVSLNDIFLYKYPGEYQLILDKYRNISGIPMEIKEDAYLTDSPIYERYISLLKEKNPVDAYNDLTSEIIVDEYNFLPKLSSLIIPLNPLNLDKEEFIEILTFLAKRKTLSNTKYDYAIRVVDSTNNITDNQYVFMLGFDVNNYPFVSKDIDFLTDEEKENMNRITSSASNEIQKEKLVNFILNTKNLTITFKKKNNKTVYYPSLLVKELNLKKEETIIDDYRYFDLLTKLEVARYKDEYYKYGERNPYINVFDNQSLGYKSFDNTFKSIKPNNPDTLISIDYTSLNTFYECPFKYFAEYILKAGTFESNYTTSLGTLFHKILEDSKVKTFDLDNFIENIRADYKEQIDNNFKTAKDNFFLNLHLEQLKEVIKKNEEFINDSFFKKDKMEVEKKFEVKLTDNVILKGKIDKTLIDDAAKKIAVIDYKTGNFEFREDLMKHGLSLQLPIYKLILESSKNKYEIIGLFIQKILVDLKKEKNEKEKYYLDGLFSDNMENLKFLDGNWLTETIETDNGKIKTITSSKYIKGLTALSSLQDLTKNAKSKTIPTNLSEICKEKVLEAADKIRNNEFPVEPIMEEKNTRSLACTYCEFKDICFMKRKDIKVIKKGDEK